MIYLDSSALVKLVKPETETAALQAFLGRSSEQRVVSALARTELVRAVLPGGPEAVAEARRVLGGLFQARISSDVLDHAATLDFGRLRSLDAIHLATALRLDAVAGVTAFLAYDKRLLEAARHAGLPTASPDGEWS